MAGILGGSLVFAAKTALPAATTALPWLVAPQVALVATVATSVVGLLYYNRPTPPPMVGRDIKQTHPPKEGEKDDSATFSPSKSPDSMPTPTKTTPDHLIGNPDRYEGRGTPSFPKSQRNNDLVESPRSIQTPQTPDIGQNDSHEGGGPVSLPREPSSEKDVRVGLDVIRTPDLEKNESCEGEGALSSPRELSSEEDVQVEEGDERDDVPVGLSSEEDVQAEEGGDLVKSPRSIQTPDIGQNDSFEGGGDLSPLEGYESV